MENYEHQQAKQTRTYRNFFEKIHKHFKNLEQKKNQNCRFLFTQIFLDWLTFSQTHRSVITND